MVIGSWIVSAISFVYFIFLCIYTGIGVSQDYLWFLAAVFFALIGFGLRYAQKHPTRWALRFQVTTSVILIVWAIIILVIQFLIVVEASKKVEPGLDYVIVLGGRIKENGKPSKALRERLDMVVDYAKDNQDTYFVLSGGRGEDEPCTEAEGMAEYLIEEGVRRDRLLVELQSRNTHQNIWYSKALIEKNIQDNLGTMNGNLGDNVGPVLVAEEKPKRIGILTSDFHLFRAMGLARKAEYREFYGISAKCDVWLYLHFAMRETLAILKDKFMGYM